jgi:hypothetical protein
MESLSEKGGTIGSQTESHMLTSSKHYCNWFWEGWLRPAFLSILGCDWNSCIFATRFINRIYKGHISSIINEYTNKTIIQTIDSIFPKYNTHIFTLQILSRKLNVHDIHLCYNVFGILLETTIKILLFIKLDLLCPLLWQQWRFNSDFDLLLKCN